MGLSGEYKCRNDPKLHYTADPYRKDAFRDLHSAVVHAMLARCQFTTDTELLSLGPCDIGEGDIVASHMLYVIIEFDKSLLDRSM